MKKGKQEICIAILEGMLFLLLFLCFLDIHHIKVQAREKEAIKELPLERLHNEKSKSRDYKKVALTFDDGPNPSYTPLLLDGLKKRGVKASFFVIGEYVEMCPGIVKRESDEGHLIGNHTYTHIQLTEENVDVFEKELLKTGALLEKITGKEVPFVRPPFGCWDKSLEEKWNMLPVLWSVDPRDWCLDDPDEIARRVEETVQDGDIILLHDCYKSSVLAAFQIIDILQARGYAFVTVDELLMD